MIIPLNLAGLALARIATTKEYKSQPHARKVKALSRPKLMPLSTRKKPADMRNPLNDLIKSITSYVSKISQKPQRDDYDTIVKSFLPEKALILVPARPSNTGKYQFADLDGDGENELIATYRLENEVNTVILKKRDNHWDKAAEISGLKHDNIDFISFPDITGEGSKQLLLGLKTKEGLGELHGYSLHDGKTKDLFTRNYNWFEVLEGPKNQGVKAKAQLAVWNVKDMDGYDIDIMHWNGSKLESLHNPASYYSRNVLPYYGRKVKQQPYKASNWFYLADALDKAEMYEDGLTAIELGMRLNPVSPSKEQFIELRERITKKIK